MTTILFFYFVILSLVNLFQLPNEIDLPVLFWMNSKGEMFNGLKVSFGNHKDLLDIPLEIDFQSSDFLIGDKNNLIKWGIDCSTQSNNSCFIEDVKEGLHDKYQDIDYKYYIGKVNFDILNTKRSFTY